MPTNPFRQQIASYGQTLGMPQAVNGGGYRPYAAGNKHYGMGRNFPTSGTVNHAGYAERDNKAKARRDAMLSRLQNEQGGNHLHPSVLRPKGY
jgi:hypothetical protein